MSEEFPQDTAITPKEIRTVFAGLMLALALASLDQNIVGIALPVIVSELGGLSQLSWVVTAFLVTSTATTPLYGKLSDMYGRKPLFIAAIVIFLAGSCLCGLSRSLTELVIFRAVQGAGAGGLITLAQTVVADLVVPRERGRYQGLFGVVFGFSSIAGPLLGGFITSALSWRWIFYINLPVGLLALALIVFGFHRPHHAVSHKVDYAGAFLLTSATVALLLVLTWGGVQHPWSSPLIVSLAALTAALAVLLVLVEQRSLEPVLSPRLLRNKVFVISTGVMAITFMGLFSAAVFLPLFFQLVLQMTPAHAGLMLAPMTGGMILASFISGRIVSRTGRYKIYPVAGLAAAAASFLALTGYALSGGDSIAAIQITLVTLGCGFGMVMPTLVVALQNAVTPREQGAATATGAFFRSLGGTLGVAIAGAILAGRLHGPGAGPGHTMRPLAQQGLQEIARLPDEVKKTVMELYRHAIGMTFLAGALITVAAFALVLFLPERPLKTSHGERRSVAKE